MIYFLATGRAIATCMALGSLVDVMIVVLDARSADDESHKFERVSAVAALHGINLALWWMIP